jgi:hypothetical protein
MKSITIHHITGELERKITAQAEAWNLDLNETVERMLENAPAPSREEIIAHRRAELIRLRESAPTWTKEEKEAFNAILKAADDASMGTFDDGYHYDQ